MGENTQIITAIFIINIIITIIIIIIYTKQVYLFLLQVSEKNLWLHFVQSPLSNIQHYTGRMLFANPYLSIPSRWQNQFVFLSKILNVPCFSPISWLLVVLSLNCNLKQFLLIVLQLFVITLIHTTIRDIPQGATSEQSRYVGFWGRRL